MTRTTKIYINGVYILIFAVIFIMLVDLMFRPNQYIPEYLYEFAIFGAIPLFLISQITDARKLLYYYAIVSFCAFLIYFIDPWINYLLFGDYMSFGFNLVLPAFFGLHIGRRYFGLRWMVLFEIICLAEIAIFANRSALLSVGLFLCVYEFILFKSIKEKIKTIILLILIICAAFILINPLLDVVLNFLREMGYNSYSLRNIQIMLIDIKMNQFNWDAVSSGRTEIWEEAKNMINTGNNLLFGFGTGAFQAHYNYYTHNIYYDLRIQYGLFGLIAFIVLIVNSIIKVRKRNNDIKLLGILFLCLWFPKLFFSIHLFKDIGIWSFFAIGFLNLQDKSIRS